MEMRESMHGKNYGQALKTPPVPDNIAMRRIESMSEDFKEQLLTRIKCSPKFALQTNESTHVAGLPQLCLSHTTLNKTFMKISCSVDTERTTGSDTFKAVNDCITSEDIFWSNCVGK
jgi:hypothetical protein